jgi:hypothetical protein
MLTLTTKVALATRFDRYNAGKVASKFDGARIQAAGEYYIVIVNEDHAITCVSPAVEQLFGPLPDGQNTVFTYVRVVA